MAPKVDEVGDDPVTGKHTHGLDAKGRLIVPAQMRRELGDVCYLVRGSDKCLLLYSEEGWQKFCAKFDGVLLSESDAMRVIFANSATCELDSQGRILIPSDLRKYAEIDKEVTIIGMPGRAELWDSQKYAESEKACLAEKSMAQLYKEVGL